MFQSLWQRMTRQTTRPVRRRPSRARLVFEALEDRLVPAPITVTSLADSGNGTLRAAISSAQSGDTISFDPTLFTPGTQSVINLGSQLPTISANITINGPGAGELLLERPTSDDPQGNNILFRQFQIAAGAAVNISGLSIDDGWAPDAQSGGAIYNNGTLTLTGCTITGSRAGFSFGGDTRGGGGVYNSATGNLTVDTCTITGNYAGTNGTTLGGGIFNDGGTLVVKNSVINNNSASGALMGYGDGGAIYSSGSLSVTNTTFTSNSARDFGGGIAIAGGTVTIDGSTFTTNGVSYEGGGGLQMSGGSVTVTNSTFEQNSVGMHGGGMELDGGTFSATNCTIDGNTAPNQNNTIGGIFVDNATATFTACTISNNTAGIVGGIECYFGILTLTNCTVTGNGGYVLDIDAVGGQEVRLTNDTFAANNGVALNIQSQVAGEALLTNCLIAGNAGADISGTVDSASSYNLIGTNGDGGLTNHVNGNQVGVANPGLDPVLSNNGGPTKTFALLPGSPALDAGTSTGTGIPTTDQRGVSRPQGAGVDIGSFESRGYTVSVVSGDQQQTQINTAFAQPLVARLQEGSGGTAATLHAGQITFTGPASGAGIAPQSVTATVGSDGTASANVTANGIVGGLYPVTANVTGGTAATFQLGNDELPSLVVNTTQDVVNPLDGLTSLREAINYADTLTTDPTITFDPTVFGTTPRTIDLNGTALPDLSQNLSIVGPGPNLLTIDAQQNSGILTIDVGATAAISGLTLTHGHNTSAGGAIFAFGGLALTDAALLDNVGNTGGALADAHRGSTVTLTDCLLAGNSTINGSGGAIFMGSATSMTLSNCTVTGNSTSQRGGAIATVNNVTLTLTNCTLTGNSTTRSTDTGGISDLGTVTLTNTIVAGNTNPNGPADIQTTFTSTTLTGTVTGSNNLIGTGGSGGLMDGADGNHVGVANALLAPLGNYGGDQQTVALLPGSLAIDGGTSTGAGIPTTDERGVSRPQGGGDDIGAFESQGFTLSYVSGDQQSAALGTAFNPLKATLAANNPNEPIAGGQVTFTVTPNANGATATLGTNPVVLDSTGAISMPATASGGTFGTFTVTAGANGAASPVVYHLNDLATPTVSVTDNGGVYNASGYGPTVVTVSGVGGVVLASLGDPSLSYTYYAGASATGNGSASAPVNVGTYTVVAHWTSTNPADYTNADGGPVTFQITQRPITVTADAQTKVYGTTDPALTYQVTSGALAGNDAFSGALTRQPGENVGNYAILQGTLTAGGNYALTYVGANLGITPAPAAMTLSSSAPSAITGQSVTFTARVAVPSGSVTFTDGTTPLGTVPLTGGVASVSTSSLTPGRHTIMATFSGNNNYAVQPVSLTQTVGDPLSGQAAPAAATTGAPYSGPIATFTDGNHATLASSFTATINWGDGTTSPATVTGGNGSFTVSGGHTYAAAGHDTVLVTVVLSGFEYLNVVSSVTVTDLGPSVVAGEAGSIAFWHGGVGQALLSSFNGGAGSTALSAWLASNFANLYSGLAGMSNTQVAAYFQQLYGSATTQLEAEALALALNVYATTSSLGGSALATTDGFTVDVWGLGARQYNVGTSGAALHLYNNTSYSVWRILRQINGQAAGGVIDGGSTFLRGLILNVAHGINTAGGL